MNYSIREKGGNVVIEDVRDFHPKHVFECGQAFRWTKEDDGSYTNIAFGKVINVRKEGNNLLIKNANKEDFKNIWYRYFDLNRDYGEIKAILGKNEKLKEAIDFGYGIRILNQEPFETLITFIISANNGIPQIKNSIERISRHYGERIGDTDYYAFPKSQVLAQADPLDLREKCRVGFRDKRIVETSKIIGSGQVDLDSIFHLDRDKGREVLLKLPGVGPKVADCVLLFAYKKADAFPVDVWMKRIMEHLYFQKDTRGDIIGRYGESEFGQLAGFAQQYLFYYGREKNIGKKIEVNQ